MKAIVVVLRREHRTPFVTNADLDLYISDGHRPVKHHVPDVPRDPRHEPVGLATYILKPWQENAVPLRPVVHHRDSDARLSSEVSGDPENSIHHLPRDVP